MNKSGALALFDCKNSVKPCCGADWVGLKWVDTPPTLTDFFQSYARVVELADTLGLGSSAARRAGSTPAPSTIFFTSYLPYLA